MTSDPKKRPRIKNLAPTTPPKSKRTAPSDEGDHEIGWQHLIGHSIHQSRWQKLITRDKLPPVLLLVGREGIGKESLLTYLTGLLYCESQSACGHCRPCHATITANHGEVFWLSSSSASQDPSWEETPPSGTSAHLSRPPLLLADAMMIQEHLQLSAGMQGRYRSVVIPDAERLTIQASNRLLKIFEELPPRCFVFMSSSRADQMLPTILSRAVKWHIAPPKKEETLALLRKRADELKEPSHASLSDECLNELLEHFSLAPGPVIRILRQNRLLSSRDANPNDSASQMMGLLGDQVSQFTKDCTLALRHPSYQRSMVLGSQWGKQLSPPMILDGFERALNHFYREALFHPSTKKNLDPFMIHDRRGILSEARKLAIRSRILLNGPLLLESLALTTNGNESYAGD